MASPAATVNWLRGEAWEEPFGGRSPLRVMEDDGRMGVEMNSVARAGAPALPAGVTIRRRRVYSAAASAARCRPRSNCVLCSRA